MDKQELKIEALTQRIAELTSAYETRIADLRVEFTIMAAEYQEYRENAEKQDGGPDVEVASGGGPTTRD